MKDLPSLERRGYTVTEVAAAYKRTPVTVYRWLHEGLLDSFTIGRNRFITRESLDRMEKRGRG